MEMANCLKCKKIFMKVREPICGDCKKEEENTFKRVKEFLDENKESTLAEIAAATDVSMKKILGYLRDGRLEISDKSGELTCRICEEPIKSGQHCATCSVKIAHEINNFIQESNEKSARSLGQGMHTRHRK